MTTGQKEKRKPKGVSKSASYMKEHCRNGWFELREKQGVEWHPGWAWKELCGKVTGKLHRAQKQNRGWRARRVIPWLQVGTWVEVLTHS